MAMSFCERSVVVITERCQRLNPSSNLGARIRLKRYTATPFGDR